MTAGTRRDELIKKLSSIQNTRAFWNVDILSITGAMSDDEVEKYVADKEQQAAGYSPKLESFPTGK